MISNPVLITQSFEVRPEALWQALTEPTQLQAWYFPLADFKPEVGFSFQFEGIANGQTFLHLCEVTEVVSFQKLTYSWRYAGFPGNTQVSFTLHPDGLKTRLELVHEGLETFPETEPALARENFVAGWQYLIGTALQTFLAAKTVAI